MATQEKINWAKFRVGILGLVALFLVTLLVFLLSGGAQWFVTRVPLHVYVSDAAGLTPGSPVRINGIPAGSVTTVALSGETNPQRIIKVDFWVDEKLIHQIPADSVASIGSDNLLGATKYLEIDKGKEPVSVAANATLQSVNTQEFDQLVKQGFGVLDSAQAILTQIQTLVGSIQNGQGTVGKLLVDPSLYNTLQSTVAQVQLLATTLNSKSGTIGQLINDDTVYKQAEGVLARLDTLTQQLQQGQGSAGLFLKDPSLYKNLDHSITQLTSILDDLKAGKGTAGQLFASDKIGNQVSATLDKINRTMDKVNSGQGTIGQLLVNPQLYDEATATTREMQQTLKDFRANPKKFLTIRLRLF